MCVDRVEKEAKQRGASSSLLSWTRRVKTPLHWHGQPQDSQLPATEAWPHWPELRDGWAWEMVQPQGAGVPLGLAEPAVSWGQASRTPWGRGKESGSP